MVARKSFVARALDWFEKGIDSGVLGYVYASILAACFISGLASLYFEQMRIALTFLAAVLVLINFVSLSVEIRRKDSKKDIILLSVILPLSIVMLVFSIVL